MKLFLSIVIAVLIAVLAEQYFSYLHEGWAPLTVLLLLAMTVRVNLRQLISRLVVVMACVLIGSLLMIAVPNVIWRSSILIVLFMSACYLRSLLPLRAQSRALFLIAAFLFLVFLLPFLPVPVLYARLHDVALGGAIGIGVALLVFIRRADEDFRKGIVPLLRAYKDYLLAIEQVFFTGPSAEPGAQQQKQRVEKLLLSEQAEFPEWVYEYGFTQVLRAGHRHFLVRVEQFGEVLFAMHYIARHTIEKNLLDKFREPVAFCVNEINNLVQAVIEVLELKKPTAAVSDLSDEIAALESVFQQNTPLSLELLDTSQEYLNLSAFIYDLKDLQIILLQLTKALR